jgi:hypothetical protein
MAQEVRVGTMLISEWPQPFGLESKPYSGPWSMVQAFDSSALDRKIRAAGWNLFFIASEVKALSFGASRIQRALNRILAKVRSEGFNGLEVTGIVAKHFLGVPYTVVSAHSRHLQETCYLDAAEVRCLSQRGAAWARG